ncbi:uncharacterized protein LOC115896442 isoform X2 [Rhinopithecus roxellana]|uniref:uncharacterized protein LOC115896442 isoform X2 n=1 Tax=Rhinopithecus roxellana TaxID=61622 RepID=UPI0012373A0C|nr:uncharacterized protein LOC115896442 isoform X2 [Rhinopithecus roxellana]
MVKPEGPHQMQVPCLDSQLLKAWPGSGPEPTWMEPAPFCSWDLSPGVLAGSGADDCVSWGWKQGHSPFPEGDPQEPSGPEISLPGTHPKERSLQRDACALGLLQSNHNSQDAELAWVSVHQQMRGQRKQGAWTPWGTLQLKRAKSCHSQQCEWNWNEAHASLLWELRLEERIWDVPDRKE